MKINEVIVVEGKNDSNVLKSYFECDTIETHGSCLSDYTLQLIKKAQEIRGVIIFTDPDSPGEKIRNEINRKINGCKNAFIQKEKSRTDKKVGIEHASKIDLEEALQSCMTYDTKKEKKITLQDLMDMKLSGYPESKALRKKIGYKLKIGESNAKTLCNRCNMLNMSIEDLKKIIEEL